VTHFGTAIAYTVSNMESKRKINNGRWFQKVLITLIFGLFTAKAQAQGLLPPVLTVSPSGTNVQNGDTVTFNVSAYCTLGLFTSVQWQFNGGALPTNATTVTTSGGILTSSISTSLTVSRASAKSAGTYTVEVSDAGGLLGILVGNASASVPLGVTTPLAAVPSASKMSSNGFNVQFSGPTGSNLVIEASSDMINWSPVYTNVLTGGSISYTDAAAKSVSRRYYRAKLK